MRFDGKKLRALRESRFKSCNKAALALVKETGIEVTGATWGNWESGKHTPGGDFLPALASLFGVAMEDFFSAGDLQRDSTEQRGAAA